MSVWSLRENKILAQPFFYRLQNESGCTIDGGAFVIKVAIPGSWEGHRPMLVVDFWSRCEESLEENCSMSWYGIREPRNMILEEMDGWILCCPQNNQTDRISLFRVLSSQVFLVPTPILKVSNVWCVI